MDAKIDSEGLDSNGFPIWDLHVDVATMCVPIITGGEEAQQQADVAAYLIKDSIPQLPGIGVDWLGFLGGATAFGDIDTQIRDMLGKAGHGDFYPEYNIVNDTLVASTKKGGTS